MLYIVGVGRGNPNLISLWAYHRLPQSSIYAVRCPLYICSLAVVVIGGCSDAVQHPSITKNGNIFVRHCLFFVGEGKKSCDNNSSRTNNK